MYLKTNGQFQGLQLTFIFIYYNLKMQTLLFSQLRCFHRTIRFAVFFQFALKMNVNNANLHHLIANVRICNCICHRHYLLRMRIAIDSYVKFKTKLISKPKVENDLDNCAVPFAVVARIRSSHFQARQIHRGNFAWAYLQVFIYFFFNLI